MWHEIVPALRGARSTRRAARVHPAQPATNRSDWRFRRRRAGRRITPSSNPRGDRTSRRNTRPRRTTRWRDSTHRSTNEYVVHHGFLHGRCTPRRFLAHREGAAARARSVWNHVCFISLPLAGAWADVNVVDACRHLHCLLRTRLHPRSGYGRRVPAATGKLHEKDWQFRRRRRSPAEASREANVIGSKDSWSGGTANEGLHRGSKRH
jgi:hypothetical protein